MNFKIISFNEKYTELLFKLCRATVNEVYSSKYHDNIIKFLLSYNQPENILKDYIEGYTALIFLDDNLVGSGCLVETNIRRVFVLPQFQRKGTGAIIINHLEQIAISKNRRFVELFAMIPSIDFYKKMFYLELGICNYMVDSYYSVNYLRMAKSITGNFINDFNINNQRFIILNSIFLFLKDEVINFIQNKNLIRAILPNRSNLNEEIIGIICNDTVFMNYRFVNGNEVFTGQLNYSILKNTDKRLTFIDLDGNEVLVLERK